MKKAIKLRFFAVIIFGLLIILTAFLSPTIYAKAAGDYRFTINNFDVTYDIKADRSMTVNEQTTILYQGADSTGFYRDIPINDGEKVKNVSVYEIVGGNEIKVDWYTEHYEGFYSLSIGDFTNKTNETHTYKIAYDYIITRPKNENAIYLNAIGYGWDCEIYDADITLKFPDGLDGSSTRYYIGDTSRPNYNFTIAGNVITAHVEHLARENGVTFDLIFNEGVLSKYFDFAPYWYAVVGAVILVILIVLKLLKFTQPPITPIVNFTAPDEMDPLVMGKYIDNQVSSKDVTSLIYYWASKGYIKINLDNQNDPILIKYVNALPAGSPEHQVIMFNNLFASDDVVQISSLTNVFYTTIEAVTRKVNTAIKGLYTKISSKISRLFFITGAVLISIIPIIQTFIKYGTFYDSITFFIMIIPSLIVYFIADKVFKNKHKYSTKQKVWGYIGASLAAAAFTVIYVAYVSMMEYYIIDALPLIIACAISFAIIIVSSTLLQRTDEYTQILNKIVGFKNFILYAEKDKLEAMLESDPQFYYHVLPYANVLGVTDIWEDKFKGLTVEPPTWMISSRGLAQTYFELKIINAAIRRSSAVMQTTMTSRPSSKGSSGGGFGGGFGGGGGGGHGGGGGRGR